MLKTLNFKSVSLILCGAIILIAGCSVKRQFPAVPLEYLEKAEISGFPEKIRFWADETPLYAEQAIKERIQQYISVHADEYKATGQYPELHYLAISGGGDAGAFAAGILNGWSKTNTRKPFAIVTGVSTGAIIAPFAFLGADYDHVIKKAYLESSTDSIIRSNIWTTLSGLIGNRLSISDSTQFKNTINTLISQP